MKKLVVFTLVEGSITTGFRVYWEISPDGERPLADGYTQLPPLPELDRVYQDWQTTYRSLDGIKRIKLRENQITNVKFSSLKWDCERQAGRLTKLVNDWLDATDLSQIIQDRLLINSGDEYRVIIRTAHPQIRQLPWHLWAGWERLNSPEIALSAPNAKRRDRTYQQQVRILIILGNSEGINIEIDRQLLSQYCQGADLHFIAQPTLTQLREQLLDKRGWDLLFFSGHSRTESAGTKGRIFLNQTDSLTVAELATELQTAIKAGLQIAVFNSCDGLGIGFELESLHIPQVIVMRQPVPDLVAQAFLKYFLAEFTSGGSFDRSVSIARDHLRQLEADFPCASWLPIIIQNRLETPPTWQSLGAISQCPYRGLAAFRAEDAEYFYGRETFTDTLVTAVKSQALTPVIGGSGSGKSSVVFAGLIPQLKKDPDRAWQIICLRPTKDPLQALATGLVAAIRADLGTAERQLLELQLIKDLHQDELGAIEFINRHQLNSNHCLLLIVDRLEELYTLVQNDTHRQRFLDNILTAIDRLPSVKLVFTLRADFYDRILTDYALVTALERVKILNLTTMNRAELTAAIELPAHKLGIKFEAGLSERILDTISDRPHSLPLLEFALTQLWAKQRDGKLTHRGYEDIGGVEQALANHSEAIYQQLTPAEQLQMRSIFLQLIQLNRQPFDNTLATSRLATKAEIGTENWDLVEQLVDIRLLVIDRETVELIHEALIKYWERLKLWIEIDGDFRIWQEQLRFSIDLWLRSNRDEGSLIRGKSLATAINWYQQHPQKLSIPERDFIDRSNTKQQQESTAKQRLQRSILRGLTGGLIAVSSCAGIAGWQWYQATIQGQLADGYRIESVSKTSQSLSTSNQQLAALNQVVTAAMELTKEPKLTSQVRLPIIAILSEILDRIHEKKILSHHTNRVASVAYSRDSQTIFSAGWDNQINIWSANGELIQTLRGESEQFLKVIAHPDGNTLISLSLEHGVKIWQRDTQTGKWLTKPRSIYRQPATAIALSSNGKTLIIATKNAEIKLYLNLIIPPLQNLKDSPEPIDLKLPNSRSIPNRDLIYEINFSPDGQTYATANENGTVTIREIDRQSSTTFRADDSPILTVSFNPNGKSIATGSKDGKIQIWNLQGKLIQSLIDRQSTSKLDDRESKSILHLNFSPNGRYLVVARIDLDLKVWDLTTGAGIATLSGHSDLINEVSFSPDGKNIGSGSADGTLRLWQTQTPQQSDFLTKKIPKGATSFNYSPNGKLLAVGTLEGRIIILDRHHRVIADFSAHSQEVMGISFSANGEYLATTDKLTKNPQIKLWKVDGTLVKTLPGYQVTFSPTQPLVAIITPAGEINITEINGRSISRWKPDPNFQAQDISARINTLNFSSNGQTLITADRSIKTWDLTGKLLSTSPQQQGNIIDISYNVKQKLTAIATDDGKITVFANTGKLIHTFSTQSGLTTVSFDQDGEVLLTGDQQGDLQLWSQTGQLLKTMKTERQQRDDIIKARFSPDDRTIMAIDSNYQIDLHNLDLSHLLNLAQSWQKK